VTLYEVLLFLHISFVILWVGSGVLFHILAFMANRTNDEAAIKKIVEDVAALGNTFYVPSSLLTLASGIWLTIEGPWSFDMLWVTLGLVGFAITFATGLFWLKPQSERVAKLLEQAGGMTPEAYAEARRLMTFGRLDYVVLFLVVFDMAVKPIGDDVGTIVFMAVVLVTGALFFGAQARAIETPAPREV
jgi:uncharacterized membrane protein